MRLKFIVVVVLLCFSLTLFAGFGDRIIEGFGHYQRPLVHVDNLVSDNELADRIAEIEERNEELRIEASTSGKFGIRKITLCGERIDVPIYLYAACKGFLMTIPVGCTVANVASAGTACATAIALSTVACGASIASITKIAKSCVGI